MLLEMNRTRRVCSSFIALYVASFGLCLAAAFEYGAFCASACREGRGGNACKCNAIHFAGKRTVQGSAEAAQGKFEPLAYAEVGDAEDDDRTPDDARYRRLADILQLLQSKDDVNKQANRAQHENAQTFHADVIHNYLDTVFKRKHGGRNDETKDDRAPDIRDYW